MRFGLILVGVVVFIGMYVAGTRLSQYLTQPVPVGGLILSAALVPKLTLAGYALAVILVLAGLLMPKRKREIRLRMVRDSDEDDDEAAIRLLKKRYAKGEITKEEYEEMKEDLE